MWEIISPILLGILFYCLVTQITQNILDAIQAEFPRKRRMKNMKSREKPMLDTIRLRVLHTACMTVDEIADKLNSTPNAVEDALKSMGYEPIYSKPDVEPNSFVAGRSAKVRDKPK